MKPALFTLLILGVVTVYSGMALPTYIMSAGQQLGIDNLSGVVNAGFASTTVIYAVLAFLLIRFFRPAYILRYLVAGSALVGVSSGLYTTISKAFSNTFESMVNSYLSFPDWVPSSLAAAIISSMGFLIGGLMAKTTMKVI